MMSSVKMESRESYLAWVGATGQPGQRSVGAASSTLHGMAVNAKAVYGGAMAEGIGGGRGERRARGVGWA